MTELDQLIADAFNSKGDQQKVNKVYLALLRSSLYVPTEKNANNLEDLKPLFANFENKYFLLAFDTIARLNEWAGQDANKIDHAEINGKAFIAGINEGVYLCLNIGNEFYKEFSPDEIKHLKMIISRIEQLKGEV